MLPKIINQNIIQPVVGSIAKQLGANDNEIYIANNIFNTIQSTANGQFFDAIRESTAAQDRYDTNKNKNKNNNKFKEEPTQSFLDRVLGKVTAQFGELHMPSVTQSYTPWGGWENKKAYQGPGTKFELRQIHQVKPVDWIDRISEAHDYNYTNSKDKHSIKKADKIMVDEINKYLDDPTKKKTILQRLDAHITKTAIGLKHDLSSGDTDLASKQVLTTQEFNDQKQKRNYQDLLDERVSGELAKLEVQ